MPDGARPGLTTILHVATSGPALHPLTAQVNDWLAGLAAGDGVVVLLVRHTSCSLLIQENADPAVGRDLLTWLGRLAPDGDDPSMRWLTHTDEGPDDMPAHLRAAVLPVTLSIPVMGGRMALGTWQGLWLVEHRRAPHRRQIAAVFQPSR